MGVKLRIDILTALPELVEAPLRHSILKRAQEADVVTLEVHDLRAFATDKHRQIDDYPFGGGAGMVLKPEPLFRAVEAIEDQEGQADDVVFLTPDGERLDQPMANRLSTWQHLIVIAGRYKGIDWSSRSPSGVKKITSSASPSWSSIVSTARKSGSGLSTMPAPPPKG